jgi:hypothetical protein
LFATESDDCRAAGSGAKAPHSGFGQEQAVDLNGRIVVKAPSAFIISSARATSNLNRAPTTYLRSSYQELCVRESVSKFIFLEQEK